MAVNEILKQSRPQRPRRSDGTYRFQHGEKGTRLYSIWAGLWDRCTNPKTPKFSIYGARGVSVTPAWRTYMPFAQWARANGYQENLQIDRRDTQGDYTPDNCQWVTSQINNNNRRNNRRLTAFGETKTVAEWARDPRCRTTASGLYQRVRIWPFPDDHTALLVTPDRPGSSLRKRVGV